MRASASSLFIAFGCTAGSDIVGSDATSTAFEPPDITGSYVVALDPPLDASEVPWFDGDLEISGPPGSLTWDFGEEVFSGAVNEAFAFDFAGEATSGGPGVDVSAGGTVILADDLWGLDGDVTFSGTSSGDLAGTFTATEVLP